MLIFDGDEMNLHNPQDEESQLELLGVSGSSSNN